VAPDSSLKNDKIREFMAVPISVCPLEALSAER
jgi:hypothetical protein